MRWPRLLAISVAVAAAPAGSRALAKPVAPPSAPAHPEFWREVVEPHGTELRVLIGKAVTAMTTADEALQTDGEWAVAERRRYFEDAYSLMKYARKLAPGNGEVLGILGIAADELGHTRQAIEALTASIAALGPDKAGADVTGRLGAIYLRQGDRDAGIRWLRQAQGPLTPLTAQPLAQLANALASRGEVTAAIEVLANAMPAQQLGYYSQELTLVSFALAVVLDRDEQRSAAFDLLDRMRTTLAQQFGTQLGNVLAKTRFAPAEDRHYYYGLLYEVLDQYAEARAEWALYAASGDTPWRARALDHLHALDAQRRRTPPPVRAQTPLGTVPFPPPPPARPGRRP